MRLFKLVQKSVAAAVAERPYLIVLEDVHLADPASLDMLDALVHHSHNLPLLILVTLRSGMNFNGSHLSHLKGSQIALTDFTPQQARRLVREKLGTDQLPLVLEQRLGVMDLTAFTLCQENKMPIMVVNFFEAGHLLSAVTGNDSVGTVISAED